MISSVLKKIIDMTEFNKYLKEARQEFCKEVSKYNVSDNLELRTACDSFLIAFDQASEKAINYTHCCKSDSEQLCECDAPLIRTSNKGREYCGSCEKDLD